MTTSTKNPYAGHRFPSESISYMVRLYFRFSLSLRMVEERPSTAGEVHAAVADFIATEGAFGIKT